MKFRLYILLLCLLPALIFAVQPTTLQVIDIRSKIADADFMAQMMSMQGTINRQNERNLPAVFLIRNNNDIYWADVLTNTYRLKRENIPFDKAFELNKANFKSQVLYDAIDKPWNRSVALAFAGAADEAAIATTTDLGLPSLDFPKDGWDNRVDAYKWEKQNLGDKTSKDWLALIPESGSGIMDMISVKKMMAIDLDPDEEAEKNLLESYVKDVNDMGKIIGFPDKRTDDVENAQINLLSIIGDRDLRYLPARAIGNLSCFMRFESVRPYRQWRDEIVPFSATDDKKVPNWLVLIYDGGSARYDGAQSIDHSMLALSLLEDNAIKKIPVGIEVPMTINDLAPPVYSQLIARQRATSAELIAAPNGDGWAIPLSMNDNSLFILGSAEKSKKLDLNSLVLHDESADSKKCAGLYTMMSAAGWRSTFVYPTKNFTEKRTGVTGVMPGFTAILGFDQANNPAELLKILDTKNESNFRIVFISPYGIPPAVLKNMLPEIEKKNTLISPTQAMREMEEFTRVKKILSADSKTTRGEPTLTLATPTIAGGDAPRVYSPITVNVRVTAGGGTPNVMLARLQYETPDGRVGASDMVRTGNSNNWSAIVPPSLQEGTYRIRARMVDGVGGGISFSPPLEINFAAPDLDGDGANDAWESYLGTNPAKADTDGDGLPDGIDQQPLTRNINIQPLSPMYIAPEDKIILVDAGTSTVGNDGRDIPDGTSISYKLPVGDIGADFAALRIVTASVVETPGRTGWVTSLKDYMQTPEKLSVGSLNVKLTAKDKPMRVISVGLVSNPKGPYLDKLELSCADKRAVDIIPGKMPINVKTVVYSPAGISEAKILYGLSSKSLQKIALQGDRLKSTFTGIIPPQPDGTILLYCVYAKDNEGNESVSPFQTIAIGKNKSHSVAMLAGRDINGDMRNSSLWNGIGRGTVAASATDSGLFLARPGNYSVWALAAPRDRGLTIKIEEKSKAATATDVKMTGTIPANLSDGWFRVGNFSVLEGTKLSLVVTPTGFAGYAGYGEVIITQDTSFTPPAKNVTIDWINGLSITGIQDGMKLTRPLSINAFATGNIDAIHVVAKRFGSGVSKGGNDNWTIGTDGHLVIDQTELVSGTYQIIISADATYKNNNSMTTIPLVQQEFVIVVPPKQN